MRRRILPLMVVLAGAGLVMAPLPVRAAEGDPTDITVTVRDSQTKAPISGVKIELRSNRSSGDAYTGDDGNAKLQTDAQAGSYFQVRGSCEGYCPVTWNLNDQGSGGKIPTAIALLLDKAVGISGTVVDQEGKPLPGAKILCTLEKKFADPHLHLSASWMSITADSDGKFSVPTAPADFDTAMLAAYDRECISAEGYLQPTAYADVAALKNGTAKLTLNRGTPLTLVVHGPEGLPVRNARVAFGSNRGSVNDYPEEKVDAQGKVTLGIARGAEALLTITAKGRAPELVRPVITDKAQTLAITLKPGNLLQGSVIDGNGDPASTGQISIQRWRGAETLHPRIRIDGEGKFTWADAPADDLVVSVWTGNEQKSDITIKAGRENVINMPAPTTFKGTVVDAATGQPVTEYEVLGGISWDKNQAMNWRPGDETGSEVAPEGGTFTVTMHQNYPQRAFRVVAPGYLPSDSASFAMAGKEVDFTFKLEKGKPIAGKLLGTDGKPVADARVMLAVAGNQVQLQNAQVNEWNLRDIASATTGVDGKFTLPPQRDEYLLLAMTDGGYVEEGKAEFEKSADVTLKPWGKVEGVVKIGTKAAAGMEVMGWANGPYNEKKPSVNWSFEAHADGQGHFIFDRVPPMTVSFGRRLDLGNNSSTQTAMETVKVEAGKTSTIQIGGVGRPVNGHIAIPPDVASGGYNFFNASIIPMKGGRSQQFVVQHDGSFHIDDVLPATYNVQVTVTDNSKPNEWMRGVSIGNVHGTFTMPAVTGGVSDDPLDIGTLKIAQVAIAGSKAPDFSVKTLDGAEWKLADQANKVVVLCFWSPTYSAATADQPKLTALWEAHGKDPHFAMLGVSLGDIQGTATKKFIEEHQIHWPTAALTQEQQPLLQTYAMQRFPTFWVINPAGVIIGQNVTVDQLESLVSQELKGAK